MLHRPSPLTPEWVHSPGLTPYAEAVAAMEARARAIREQGAPGLIWLLEHPPLYTAGTSAKAEDVLNARFPIHQTGRGGQYTYHGPGQRVAYAVLDLKALFAPEPPDLRAYVKKLEQWIIAALAEFGVEGFTREGRVGVWVEDRDSRIADRESYNTNHESRITSHEKKIAALGIRVKQWVAYHGVCINVHPDLSHYGGIVPCGISDYGVTSLRALGVKATMAEVDAALKRSFKKSVLGTR